MAGVLEHIIGSKRRLVFGVRISEVEEMLQQRCEVEVQSCSREDALWQESFCLAE
jgi:hypothetical protein